eukprot:TRINITY_DN26416_c0_g1_i1.p1 TRINITY_DN26416_c0_g1~~TRINITY_DN26416_c0_g1_i1.p1  ORF type:complete len:393 (+),score=91.09 TRINITY_DN26416_c0_g1_i1:86-1180(+)
MEGGKPTELGGSLPHYSLSDERPPYGIAIVVGTSNPNLGKDICTVLKTNAADSVISTFADGELSIQIDSNIRGTDAFIIQPTCPDVNKNLMELLLLIHTLNLASAKRVTAVVPYFGYARQDRKTKPRVPISASAVSQLIEAMGPDRLITVDLHCGQIQGFFHHIPVDNLLAEKELVAYLRSSLLKKYTLDELAVVSPDAGGVQRAQLVADELSVASVVTIIKRRAAANQIQSMQVVGTVVDKVCLIVDDIIDTAGTLCKAAGLLKDSGAKSVMAIATHGVFSQGAVDRIQASVLESVVVTDSIPQYENIAKSKKLHVISLAPLLARAIKRVHEEKSLSVLFTPEHKAISVELEEEKIAENGTEK